MRDAVVVRTKSGSFAAVMFFGTVESVDDVWKFCVANGVLVERTFDGRLHHLKVHTPEDGPSSCPATSS